MQKSIAVRNASLNAQVAAIGASAILKVRSGAMPANCAAADAGSVLATLNLPSTWMGAAANGVASKSGTWEDLSADAGGLAGYYRLYASDGTTCHGQGLVAQPWVASTAFVVGQQVVNNGNAYRCSAAGTSASSGGPTGTGASITDGGVTWAYLGPCDLTLDNSNFALGQSVSVASFSMTAGNA